MCDVLQCNVCNVYQNEDFYPLLVNCHYAIYKLHKLHLLYLIKYRLDDSFLFLFKKF